MRGQATTEFLFNFVLLVLAIKLLLGVFYVVGPKAKEKIEYSRFLVKAEGVVQEVNCYLSSGFFTEKEINQTVSSCDGEFSCTLVNSSIIFEFNHSGNRKSFTIQTLLCEGAGNEPI